MQDHHVNQPLSDEYISKLAAQAGVCPRTALRYLAGLNVWTKTAEKLRAAALVIASGR
jgi:hypothetical protein